MAAARKKKTAPKAAPKQSRDANAKKPAKRKPPPRDLDEAQAKKQPHGRPSKYTKDIADEIISRLVKGETLTRICRDNHIPAIGTVLGWVTDDREQFSERYARARALQLDIWGDETIDIADESTGDIEITDIKVDDKGELKPVVKVNQNTLARATLRISTRHWLMTRLNDEKYGVRSKVNAKIGIGRHESLLDQLDEVPA